MRNRGALTLPDIPAVVNDLVTFVLPPRLELREQLAAPELKLWAAVLEDALRVYCDRIYYARNLDKSAAEAWLFSQSNHVGSFQFVCDVLNQDAELIRDKLREVNAHAKKTTKPAAIEEHEEAHDEPMPPTRFLLHRGRP